MRLEDRNMPDGHDGPGAGPVPRWPVVCGALLSGAAVALAAAGAHGDEDARRLMSTAAAFAFGHGVALIALAGIARGRWGSLASLALLAGTVLFAGSLAARALLGASSALAPWGGGLLMLGWLLHAVAAARR
jgi:uncharacterized membrane protein YgdD (TMEM256/DUF423 family)